MNEYPLETRTGDVVAALDSTEHDGVVATWAAAEAERSDSTLRLVSVVDAALQMTPYEALVAGSPSLTEHVDSDARRHVDQVAETIRGATPGLKVVTDVLWGSPAAGLVESSQGARLLVMGSPAHAGIGSVVVPVMAHADCPVVIVPEGSRTGRPRTAVVGVDGSDHSRHALAHAMSTVQPVGGSVTAVAAWRPEIEAEMLITYVMADSVPEIDARYASMLDDVVAEVGSRFPDVAVTPLVRHGHTAPVLLEVAREQDADLVVVGSRGRGGFTGLLLGSVSRRVAAKADRPVAVVR